MFAERGEDMIGAVLGGRFEVEERIGRRGMVGVFLSKDLLLRGLAAAKVLREGNTDARRRFADEGRLLADLRDPHMVRVLRSGRYRLGHRAWHWTGPGRASATRRASAMAGGGRPRGPGGGGAGGAASVGVIDRDVKPSNIIQLDGADGGEARSFSPSKGLLPTKWPSTTPTRPGPVLLHGFEVLTPPSQRR